MKRFALAAAVAWATIPMAHASAASLVTNGGFESGDFAGWTQVGNTNSSGVDDGIPADGLYGAYFGPASSLGGISQALATIAGHQYAVSFKLGNDGGTPTAAQIAFGGDTLLSEANAPGHGYIPFSFNAIATSASSVLSFEFQQQPGYYYLDSISVTDLGQGGAVPEPVAWRMMILGFGIAGALLRKPTARRARVLEVR